MAKVLGVGDELGHGLAVLCRMSGQHVPKGMWAISASLMSILGTCFGTGLGCLARLSVHRHIEDLRKAGDAVMRDGFVHDRVAGLAHRGEFCACAIRLTINKSTRRFACTTAFQAIELIRR